MAALLQLGDDPVLVLRQDLRDDVDAAELGGDALGSGAAIAGEHRHTNAVLPKLADHGAGIGAQPVLDPQAKALLAIDRTVNQGTGAGNSVGVVVIEQPDAAVRKPGSRADAHVPAVDPADDAGAGNGPHLTDLEPTPGNARGLGKTDDGIGGRVLGAPLQGRGQGERAALFQAQLVGSLR